MLMIYIHLSFLSVLDLGLLIVSCICGAYFSLPRSRVMNGREPHPWWPHRVLVLWIKGTLFWGLSLFDSAFWYHLFPVCSLNSLFAFSLNPHHLIWMWWYSQVGWSPFLSGHKGSEWKNNHSAALLAMMQVLVTHFFPLHRFGRRKSFRRGSGGQLEDARGVTLSRVDPHPRGWSILGHIAVCLS